MAVDPTPEQFAALMALEHDGPVQMINLLQFKPDGGLAGYERYAAEVQSHLEAVGGRAVAISATRQLVIGDEQRPWWDAILTVEYPSIQAFLKMVTNPEYLEIARYRTEALARAELIATAPGTIAPD